MKLDSIAEYLILSGLVSDGYSSEAPALYLYKQPSESEKTTRVLLISDPAGFELNEQLPGYFKGRIQVIVTAYDYDEGHELAEKLSERLTMRRVDFPDSFVFRCMPKHTPRNYPSNEQNALEFSVNFDITLRLK